MLNWLLITSITLVSTTLLMYNSAYIAIFDETAEFYQTTKQKVILLPYTFNIFYLIVSIVLFRWLKVYYSIIVKISTLLIAIGCVGRYLAHTDYTWSLWFSILVGISHVPIITAPYGLLGLFEPTKRGYASSIPLFVPVLGINFCILYGMNNIAGLDFSTQKQLIVQGVNTLNLIIAIVGTVSAFLTIILMNSLRKQIRQINEDTEEAKNSKGCFQAIKSEFKSYKTFIFVVLSWGTILGIHWTYGGMFGVFLQGTSLSNKQIAMMGLYANLSSAVFCNLGNWISNQLKASNLSIIFYLNILGFLASLFIQASTILPHDIFSNQIALVVAIIILRAGFSSFVSLCLIQLSSFGPGVLVSSIFFYVANATNLIGGIVVTKFEEEPSIGLGIMSLVIWLCIFIVYMSYGTHQNMMQIQSEEQISVTGKEQQVQMKETTNINEQ